MTIPAHPHPEWKRLAEAIQPFLSKQELFSYDDMAVLAGIDLRSPRGRPQFYRFRKYALTKWGLWFECERSVGYRVTKAEEHQDCSMERAKRGRRQYKNALDIAVLTSEDGVSAAIIAAKRQLAASIGAILQAHEIEAKKLRSIRRSLLAPEQSSAAETLKGLKKVNT